MLDNVELGSLDRDLGQISLVLVEYRDESSYNTLRPRRLSELVSSGMRESDKFAQIRRPRTR